MLLEVLRFAEKFGRGGYIHLEACGECRARMVRDDGKVFREVESNLWDVERRKQEMDSTHVDVQVLSPTPVFFSYQAPAAAGAEICRWFNDRMTEVAQSDRARFRGLAMLPLQAPDLAAREAERISKLGLHGVEIGTHVGLWNLDAPELNVVWSELERNGLPIFVHPWDMLGEDRMKEYWLPWLVGMPTELAIALTSLIGGGVFERYPKLRFAFAHGGGAAPGIFGRIEHGFRVRPDLCMHRNPKAPRDYLGRFWVDALVHDPGMLRQILTLFGENRVCIGSDYPYPLGEDRPGSLVREFGAAEHWEEERLRRVLVQNALDWLGER